MGTVTVKNHDYSADISYLWPISCVPVKVP